MKLITADAFTTAVKKRQRCKIVDCPALWGEGRKWGEGEEDWGGGEEREGRS